jgi:hypothetical protein
MRNELTTSKRVQSKRWVVTVVVAILLCLAVLYLGEYFGVHWVREAGGSLVRASL